MALFVAWILYKQGVFKLPGTSSSSSTTTPASSGTPTATKTNTTKSNTTTTRGTTTTKSASITTTAGNTEPGTGTGKEPKAVSDWQDGLSSQYNIRDPAQNHDYIGMIYCSDKAGILGKKNGEFTDDDNLVALSSKHFDGNEAKYCGAKIEIENVANGRRTVTYIMDRMAAQEATIDMTPRVCRDLGWPGTTWLQKIRWRLLE